MCFEDMEEAFTAVLNSEHPEEELFGLSRGLVDERDAILKANPHEWINVMIPGLGRFQVPRHGLEFIDTSVVEPNSKSLISLTLGFDKEEDATSDGVADFLNAIGPILKSLPIDGVGPRMNLNERRILRRCPHLEELSFCGGLVGVFFDFRE
ncbi:hypothetical protein F443_09465 [Phytophthora nicotianae P1569]|uniref:Uncharacterized protein n=4 Tax=Phytophthora nicotianae TaxID=4792 RepID=V9F5T6_PHYNI|nr:hypothetical protein F443_09465 [Phytophthora nicotianae P1569]ETO73782.1 hypothetical protein F444_10321 [Phytophthora nicotianae P1976]